MSFYPSARTSRTTPSFVSPPSTTRRFATIHDDDDPTFSYDPVTEHLLSNILEVEPKSLFHRFLIQHGYDEHDTLLFMPFADPELLRVTTPEGTDVYLPQEDRTKLQLFILWHEELSKDDNFKEFGWLQYTKSDFNLFRSSKTYEFIRRDRMRFARTGYYEEFQPSYSPPPSSVAKPSQSPPTAYYGRSASCFEAHRDVPTKQAKVPTCWPHQQAHHGHQPRSSVVHPSGNSLQVKNQTSTPALLSCTRPTSILVCRDGTSGHGSPRNAPSSAHVRDFACPSNDQGNDTICEFEVTKNATCKPPRSSIRHAMLVAMSSNAKSESYSDGSVVNPRSIATATTVQDHSTPTDSGPHSTCVDQVIQPDARPSRNHSDALCTSKSYVDVDALVDGTPDKNEGTTEQAAKVTKLIDSRSVDTTDVSGSSSQGSSIGTAPATARDDISGHQLRPSTTCGLLAHGEEQPLDDVKSRVTGGMQRTVTDSGRDSTIPVRPGLSCVATAPVTDVDREAPDPPPIVHVHDNHRNHNTWHPTNDADSIVECTAFVDGEPYIEPPVEKGIFLRRSATFNDVETAAVHLKDTHFEPVPHAPLPKPVPPHPPDRNLADCRAIVPYDAPDCNSEPLRSSGGEDPPSLSTFVKLNVSDAVLNPNARSFARSFDLVDLVGHAYITDSSCRDSQQLRAHLAHQSYFFCGSTTHNSGYEIPSCHTDAVLIDKKYGNTKWQDAEQVEINLLRQCLMSFDRGKNAVSRDRLDLVFILLDYLCITALFRYNIKHDGRYKARAVITSDHVSRASDEPVPTQHDSTVKKVHCGLEPSIKQSIGLSQPHKYTDTIPYHDTIMGRAATDINHLVDVTPTDLLKFKSKRQDTNQLVTYEPGYTAARTTTDPIVTMRNTQRYLGVPITKCAVMLGSNQFVVVASPAVTHSTLTKHYKALSCLCVREVGTARTTKFPKHVSSSSSTDIISEHFDTAKPPWFMFCKTHLFSSGVTTGCKARLQLNEQQLMSCRSKGSDTASRLCGSLSTIARHVMVTP